MGAKNLTSVNDPGSILSMTSRPAEYTPRAPSENEIAELSTWLMELENGGYDGEAAVMTARNAYIAVFDHYQTGGPGYCGKLMSVIWDGAPSVFNTFIWRDGKMNEMEHELMAS